jgi:hypothetical protein
MRPQDLAGSDPAVSGWDLGLGEFVFKTEEGNRIRV